MLQGFIYHTKDNIGRRTHTANIGLCGLNRPAMFDPPPVSSPDVSSVGIPVDVSVAVSPSSNVVVDSDSDSESELGFTVAVSSSSEGGVEVDRDSESEADVTDGEVEDSSL